MWSIGDTVIYGTSGVCRIAGKEAKSFGDTKKEYLLLTPLGAKQSSMIYIPTDNAALLANIHKPLSKKEFLSLLPTVLPFSEDEWGKDTRGHSKLCKSVLASGDRLSLMRLIRTVFGDTARKPTSGEESAALRAAAMLYEELSLAFEMVQVEVVPFVLGQTVPKARK